MIWDILNATLRLVVTVIVIYKLAQFRETANLCERIGMGLAGGGSFMTIPIIMEGTNSPFDGWAVTVMSLGFVLWMGGRTWRDMKHHRNNRRQLEFAKEWEKGR